MRTAYETTKRPSIAPAPPRRERETYTTRRQIEGMHRMAHIYADIGWPDLKPPSKMKFTPDCVTRKLEEHMAQSATLREMVARENARANKNWFKDANVVGEAASAEKLRRMERIVEMLEAEPGLTVREIGEALNCSDGAVTRYARILMGQKRITGQKTADQRYQYFPVRKS